MKYKIEITESLKKEVEVEAKNEHEAMSKVVDMYNNNEIVLYDDDYNDTSFQYSRSKV
jgi:hypothetical protein